MMEHSPEDVSSDSEEDHKKRPESEDFDDKVSPDKFILSQSSDTYFYDEEERPKGQAHTSDEQEEGIFAFSLSSGKSLSTESEEEFSDKFDLYSDVDVEGKPFPEELVTTLQREEDDRQLSIIEARLFTISRLKELLEERRSLKLKNNLLHKKCKDYLGRYKIMSYFEKPSGASIYDDKKYEDTLDTFKRIQSDTQISERHCRNELRELEEKYQDKLFIFEEIKQKFFLQQSELSESLEGKFPPKKIQFLMRRQEKRIKNLVKIRVAFFKLKNSLDRINHECDRMNDYGDGRTVNVYTNLLATKNSLGERLDEREEEVGRIRKQLWTMGPILAHVKETSRGLSLEIDEYLSKLKEMAGIADQSRTLVVKWRRKKDLVRKKFSKLYQTAFLLVNPKLSKFLLDSAEEHEFLKEEIKSMKLLETNHKS
ncbi:uncharacterized protein LOC135163063 [Diachasmimorpha longicaudata]|uniref:uncharacterized protein LOC135163063 n=1 Tax=Diachasmimorpha longicaudata TaxID=58733 RepID=UPI0030B8A913